MSLFRTKPYNTACLVRRVRFSFPMGAIFLGAVLLFCLCACADKRNIMPLGQDSFEAYRLSTTQWLTQHRQFQTDDRTSELLWNSPREWRPEGTPEKGILLVHGLGDSPWSFNDIGPILASHGFLVRTVLLPGCGTKPVDMIGISADDWRRVVVEQTDILRREVREVFLGGFSTGANLVLEYAYAHPEIQGLVLFSPGIKSDEPLDFLAPFAALFSDWLLDPDSGRPLQDPMRYSIVPTNGFAQFYRTSVAVRRLIQRTTFDRPVVMILSEHDSVLDVRYILKRFTTRFTHPQSRLIWYGAPVAEHGERVLVRPDALPEWRISAFSHMGVLFSPHNEEYGFNGTQRICWNGESRTNYQRCLAGEEVWFADWDYEEPGKVHARLTFNPYFDWQASVILEVLESGLNYATTAGYE